MEDFYERYIEKEQIISQACDCIQGNSSSKLKEEITQIKDTINKLSLQENWQDSIGDVFEELKTSFNNTLTTVESSIASDFKNSENIYLKLKVELQRLKTTNDLYQKTYLGRPKNIEDPDYENELSRWKKRIKNLKTKCINLSDEIDKGFKELNNINSINLSVDLPSLANSIGSFVGVVGGMGTFLAGNVLGQYGTIISGIDGRQYTIYNQGEISGWGGFCNRAAAASIASAFAKDGQDPIMVANEVSDNIKNQHKDPGIGYKQDDTNDYFKRFGLVASVNKVDCKYDSIKDNIVSSLKKGDKVMFDLSERGVVGDSGQQWTTDRHWVAALDFKTVNGKDYIFISDSGHDGSTKDYCGVGKGWYSIDEFDGEKVANVTIVSQNNSTVVVPSHINQSGYTVTCYEKDGWHFNAGTKATGVGVGQGQKLIHDAWNSQGSNYVDGGIAVIDDNGTPRYLVATSEEIGKVGDRLTVNFENGQSINVLVADQKSKDDPNYTIYGHSSGDSVNILEFEVNTHDFNEKHNPTTEKWGLSWDSSSPITSIDNHGSAKDDIASQNGIKV